MMSSWVGSWADLYDLMQKLSLGSSWLVGGELGALSVRSGCCLYLRLRMSQMRAGSVCFYLEQSSHAPLLVRSGINCFLPGQAPKQGLRALTPWSRRKTDKLVHGML